MYDVKNLVKEKLYFIINGGLKMINQERLLAEFLELVQIKCSTKEERVVADLLKTRLTKLNMEIFEDNVGELIGGNCGNVFAYLKGTLPNVPVLMLAAHMDCVEPCANVKPQRKDGMITSDGSTILGADDKAGVVAILEALRVITEQNISHGDIQVVLTVAEESGLNGSKYMDKSLLKADFGYELDSSGRPGTIVTEAPGQNKIDVTIHGKTAHAGIAPEEGINAIVIAGKALSQIKDGRIDEETTANIGMIKGGLATNIVPNLVEITCEARSRNLSKLNEQTMHMRETFERVATANGARAEVEITKSYNPYILTKDAPVITLATQAAQSVGLAPKLEGTGGGSDANFYNSYDVSCAVLGVGMQKVHTTEEFIIENDLYQTAAFVVEIIKGTARMKK